MPKTRNAFALRGFDSERIFQRIYVEGKDKSRHYVFDWLELGIKVLNVGMLPKKAYELTDEDFFIFCCRQVKNQQAECEYSGISLITKILKNVSEEVATYLQKVSRHSRRLEEYSRKWNEKICSDETMSATEIRIRTRRIQELLKSYAETESTIEKLHHKIENCITEIEEEEKAARKIFATRLRQARTTAGMTQQEVADKLDISRNAYTMYETGKRDMPTLTLAKLSVIYQQSTDWLLGITD